MFILYFALWVVLNGRWTTEIGVFGLVFATAVYAFTWKYMDFGPKLDLALVRRMPSAVRYAVTLLAEIIKANLVVARMILDGEKEPKPQLVKFDVDLKKNRHLVALANSITLTPGTITVDLHDNHFTVHALDASLVDGLDDGVFVQQLMDMEEKHMAQDAAKETAAKKAEPAEAVQPCEEEKPAEAVQPCEEEKPAEAVQPCEEKKPAEAEEKEA